MLSDIDVLQLLARDDDDALVITPIVAARQIQPASIDLRLGFHFKTARNAGIAALDPINSGPRDFAANIERYIVDVRLAPGEAFYIHPGEFALGTSFEFVRIPTNIAATLEGRSSLGRLGITIHSTAGFIDPGFAGRITYEIQNEGTHPIALYPGLRVAQLCFFRLSRRAVRPYGSKGVDSKYHRGQLYAAASRWYEDKDLALLGRVRERLSPGKIDAPPLIGAVGRDGELDTSRVCPRQPQVPRPLEASPPQL